MDIHLNFEQLFFPGTDEGYAGPYEIPGGFPFGDSIQTEVYVSISPGQAHTHTHSLNTNILFHRLDQMEFCHLAVLIILSSI